VIGVADNHKVAAVDIRIETFMRDIASDKGKSARVIAENTRQRVALILQSVRKDGDPLAADRLERRMLDELERRVADEMERYRGTRSEEHFALVLKNLDVRAAAAAAAA